MLIFSVLLSFAFASTQRIESKYVNIAESSKIYLRPGLISVLEFPQNIIEARVGNPNDLKVLISTVSPREITLYFKNSNVLITNLIIRSDRKLYVFDIIPSKTLHQDYIKISGSFGVLNKTNNLKLVKSSELSSYQQKSTDTKKTIKLTESISL